MILTWSRHNDFHLLSRLRLWRRGGYLRRLDVADLTTINVQKLPADPPEVVAAAKPGQSLERQRPLGMEVHGLASAEKNAEKLKC